MSSLQHNPNGDRKNALLLGIHMRGIFHFQCSSETQHGKITLMRSCSLP